LYDFLLELTSVQTARQLKFNRHTVDRYYEIFREKIAAYEEEHLQQLSGNIEIDESYFGSRHTGDKRERGAPNKIPVVVILKRKGKVSSTVILDASSKILVLLSKNSLPNRKPMSIPTNSVVTMDPSFRVTNIIELIIHKNLCVTIITLTVLNPSGRMSNVK
jgi:hypothetical protein